MAHLTLSRGQLLLSSTHTNTLSSCHKQRETSCSSFARRLCSLHGLAGFAETINPSVNATDGLERSTTRRQQGRGEMEMEMALDKHFYLFYGFFLRQNYCSGKIDFPGHISPGTQTIQRLSGDGAADTSCNIYQVLRKRETHGRLRMAFKNLKVNNATAYSKERKAFHCFGFALTLQHIRFEIK